MLDLIEPPYTERYVWWCERAIKLALLDFRAFATAPSVRIIKKGGDRVTLAYLS